MRFHPAACTLLFASVYKVEQASDGSHLPGSATRPVAGCAPLYTLAAGDELLGHTKGTTTIAGLLLVLSGSLSLSGFFFPSCPYFYHAEKVKMYSALLPLDSSALLRLQ